MPRSIRVALCEGSRCYSAAMTGHDLDTAAHIIQLALTPVFLLSGIATLLNVFATRLERVASQTTEQIAEDAAPEKRQALLLLRRRSFALDAAVLMAAIAGVCTCATVLVLFVGEIYERSVSTMLYAIFGGATILTIGALGAFVYEMLLAARGVRLKVEKQAQGTDRTG